MVGEHNYRDFKIQNGQKTINHRLSFNKLPLGSVLLFLLYRSDIVRDQFVWKYSTIIQIINQIKLDMKDLSPYTIASNGTLWSLWYKIASIFQWPNNHSVYLPYLWGLRSYQCEHWIIFLDAVLLWGFQKVSGDAVVGLTWLIEFTSAGYKMVGETGPWSKVEGRPSKGYNESHGCAVERFPPLFFWLPVWQCSFSLSLSPYDVPECILIPQWRLNQEHHLLFSFDLPKEQDI